MQADGKTRGAQRPVTEVEARIGRVGLEQAPFIVIDDFWSDPEYLVDYAAQCSFSPPIPLVYPGVRAPAPEEYVRGVVERIEPLVRAVFGVQDQPLIGTPCNFSIVTTPPEKLQLKQLIPHFDTTDVHRFAVLHYLCPADRGGTSLYRHRKTGYESVTKDRLETYLSALDSEVRAFGPPLRAYINGDTALFERIESLDAAFNRIVIYRSANLHSGNIGQNFCFEPDVHKGRLTLNTFLQFGAREQPLRQ